MSQLINTSINIQQSTQETRYIDTQSNSACIKHEKTYSHSEKRDNYSLKTLLISRKHVIQETHPQYLTSKKDSERKNNLEGFIQHIPYTKNFSQQENQLQSIKQKLEHTPLIFQQLLEKTIIKTKKKTHQNRKEQKKRRYKKKKKTVFAKYWDNQAPIFSLGENAKILKKALSRETKKTKVLLPEKTTKTLNTYSDSHHLLDPSYWNRIVKYWLSLSQNGRQKSIDALLQPTTIDNSDPRKKLHGQYGVLAATDIPPYSVIAPYSGLYCIGSDILKEKAYYGENADRYAVDCSIDNVQVDLCGYGHGNITLCINANTTYYKDDPILNDNACFALIIYQGWPYIFVISISEIQKSTEVLIDYGQYYWKGY